MKIFPGKLLQIITLLILVFCLGGCWDRRELDNLSIATGIGIDATQEPDMIELTAQIVNVQNTGSSNKGQEGEGKKHLNLKAQDKSLIRAIHSISLKNTRGLFLHHNQIIVLGEEIAKQGIKTHLDYLIRDQETRMEVFILVAEGKASEVLDLSLELENIPGFGVMKMLKNYQNTSQTLGVPLLDFTSSLLDKYTSPTASLIKIIEENGTQNLALSGMAVFKDDKMKGSLNPNETRGYLWTIGKNQGGIIEAVAEDGFAFIEITNSKTKLSPILHQDSSIDYKVEIQAKGTIAEIHGFKNKELVDIFPAIKEAAQKSIYQDILACINKAQSLNCDIYGFGSTIHKRHPKKWKEIKDQWDILFPKINLNIDVDIELGNTGKIADSLIMLEDRE